VVQHVAQGRHASAAGLGGKRRAQPLGIGEVQLVGLVDRDLEPALRKAIGEVDLRGDG